MKTILLATDFSKAAHNSCLYGMALARAFDARVILFNAYQQVPVPATETIQDFAPENKKAYVQEQLDNEASLVNRAAVTALETFCVEGPAVNSILKAAKDNNADIIVTGMKGNGKTFRRVMGSTVTALAIKTTIPLIVVPEEAQYNGMDAIALASENDIQPGADVHLLDMLRAIGEKFGSRLYVVRIARNEFNEEYEIRNRPFRLQNLLSALAPDYKCIEGKDLPRAFNEFARAYHVKMLALMPHKYSLLERWFVKSTTRSMIFASNIPLLILPEHGTDEN